MNAPAEQLTEAILAAAIQVHSELGPGLLERAYVACLAHELTLRGHVVRRHLPVPLRYKGVQLENAYQLDLLVDDAVVVEVKSVERLLPVHRQQLLTYLRGIDRDVGLLLNFNVMALREGIRRCERPSRDPGSV